MNYLRWHYFEVWPKILTLWGNLILFPFFYFSIPIHLKTLFAPWRRQQVKKKIGFHLDDILGVISFNIISRILGALIKLTVICYGLVFMIILAIVWAIPVVSWPLIPLVTLPFYASRTPEKETRSLVEKSNGDLNILYLLLTKHPMGKFTFTHLNAGLDKIVRPQEFVQYDKAAVLKDVNLNLSYLYKFLAENYLPVKTILEQNKLKSEDVYQTALWYEKLYQKAAPPLLLDLVRIKNLQGVGHNWAYGYTVELDKYAQDLTRVVPDFPLLVGREKEIETMERILMKTEGNNVLVVGEPGVARHLLVETLAYRILTGHSQRSLSHKRILQINMHSLSSAKPTILEVKGLAEELFEEAHRAGNIIVCIDEIDKFVSTGEGRIDLSDVITKFAQSSIGVIGITTPFSYHKFIKTNSTLSPMFEKVDIEAFPKETMIDILEIAIAPVLEKKYGLVISYPAIVKTIEDADRYITATPFPAKAIELLDEACVFVTTKKKEGLVTASHIDEFLTEKMHMPVGDLQKVEAEKLANLESLLHLRIINQQQAISSISAALRRSRLNVTNPNKPVGSFLFLGPTGVGKTETAKALASVYFNSQERLNRFDMSQYQKEEGLERLIGSAKTGSPGELTTQISDEPFSIILLDEFEKADREIFNLFLTLLDEGYITDATGRKISAKNNIIIATSNAGAEFIRERLQQGLQGDPLQKELLEYVQREKIFSPELLNRFDAVVVFEPLSEGQLREVARLMLADLNKRLAAKEISVDANAELIRKIASLGFDPAFGARAMKRAIAENIEDQIAQKLLRGEVQKGEQIHIQL